MGNVQKKEYDTTENPAIKNPDWMSSIADEKSLCDLSIPGTNKSMFINGGDAFQHQSWNLISQYEAGIRFVNIVLKVNYDNVLVIPIRQYLNFFDEILRHTINFLINHSKETILMHVYENTTFGKSNQFSKLVTNSIQKAGMSWFWTSSAIPTLGQVRGKIIILQDYDGPAIGIPYKSLVVAENKYIPTVLAITDKFTSIFNNLDKAQKSNGDKLYLTFSAGSSWLAYPYTVAQQVNYNLYKFLEHYANKKYRWGIIAMDFPGSFLVQLIIQSN
ncbi:uncharacterized protein LOC115474859 [Microcaecilia unicolor]|uniref:Uncharacterized protein LOC115474859 n=1 Tax=Microcaecilia unicolor TaxID=1415580 RepID=A0A6P7YMZ6_9AMPH|nr:uncharacterized protein LOC115474859 [Microcaecilia unicolor]